MKVSLASTVLLLASGLVSATPIRQRRANNKNIAGAAYFITNEAKGTGNNLVSANILSDGTLSFGRALAAGGRGAHGLTTPVGPDALFSQGAVKVADTGNFLATINAGANTVTMFAINPQNPTDIQMVGQPVSSGGEFPMSLAIKSDGSMVCVLNGGAVNGVNCYSVDDNLGLVAMENNNRPLGLNQTTPATGPAGSASHIVFNANETQLIASVKGTPPTPGFIAVWDIDTANNNTLSADFQKVPPATGGVLPFSMTVIKSAPNALLSTDPGIGFTIFDLSGANKSSAVPINGQSATCWSSFSTKTGNFYLTDIGTSKVTEVNVDANLKGTIVNQYPQINGSATIDNDIATIGSNDFMYVMSPNATAVQVLALNAPGKAQNIQTFDFSQDAANAGVTVSPDNLQGMATYVMKTTTA
jgi:hypothetical protein